MRVGQEGLQVRLINFFYQLSDYIIVAVLLGKYFVFYLLLTCFYYGFSTGFFLERCVYFSLLKDNPPLIYRCN